MPPPLKAAAGDPAKHRRSPVRAAVVLGVAIILAALVLAGAVVAIPSAGPVTDPCGALQSGALGSIGARQAPLEDSARTAPFLVARRPAAYGGGCSLPRGRRQVGGRGMR